MWVSCEWKFRSKFYLNLSEQHTLSIKLTDGLWPDLLFSCGFAGGCECIPGKPVNLPICQRSCGEENPSSEGCTLRFCQRIFWALEFWSQPFPPSTCVRIHTTWNHLLLYIAFDACCTCSHEHNLSDKNKGSLLACIFHKLDSCPFEVYLVDSGFLDIVYLLSFS